MQAYHEHDLFDSIQDAQFVVETALLVRAHCKKTFKSAELNLKLIHVKGPRANKARLHKNRCLVKYKNSCDTVEDCFIEYARLQNLTNKI